MAAMARRSAAWLPAMGRSLPLVAGRSASGTPNMNISDKRLQQFLKAEVTHFATMERQRLTLEDLLRHCSTPLRAAMRVSEDIPKHFAARMRMIEEVKDWEKDESLVELHHKYTESFNDIRLTEVDPDDLAPFSAAVSRLKERQQGVTSLIEKAMQKRPPDEREFWNDMLERFFDSRVFTEMLTSQYVAVASQFAEGKSVLTGIVDPECCPEAVCAEAAEEAQKICEAETGIKPIVKIRVRVRKRKMAFSYLPSYLKDILVEALKNSCLATAHATAMSSDADPLNAKPIKIVICSDDHRVAIRIADLSGGMSFDEFEHAWDFCKPSSSGNSPLSQMQLGVGLPLSRLYANYLGGSLHSVSLPEFGMNTYLFLRRVDITDALEECTVTHDAL